MAHSSPARWLAPLALVAAFLVLVVVFATSLDSQPTESGPSVPVSTKPGTAKQRGAATPTTPKTAADKTPTTATYTVQSGDFLSTVADKTGVSVERLRQLNPGLDANSMHVGQTIRLK